MRMATPEELETQLRALQRRVEALEARFGAAAPATEPEPEPESGPEPVRAAVPASMPPPLPKAAPRGEKPTRDLERFVGLAVLGRLGVLAIVLAAAYFGQLGWDRLGPGARMLVIYAGAAVLYGLGEALRSRVQPRYTALLWGGGVALAYLGGVLGHLRFDVLGEGAAMVLLLATVAGGQVLALRLRLEVMATVALAGAFAAPVLVGTPRPEPTGFFVLLAALHGWAAFLEHRFAWWVARAFAVAATTGLVAAWYLRNEPTSVTSLLAHAHAMTLVLVLPELLRAAVGRDAERRDAERRGAERRGAERWRAAALLVVGTFAQLGVLWHMRTQEEAPAAGLIAGAVLLTIAVAIGPRAATTAAAFGRVACLVLPFAVLPFAHSWQDVASPAADDWWRLGTFVVVAASLLAARARSGVGELGIGLAAVLAVAITATVPELRGFDRAQAPLVVLVPLVLLVLGRGAIAPCVGALLAAVAVFVGLRPPERLSGPDAAWASVALALIAGVGALAAVLAARRRQRVLAAVAVLILVADAIGWAALTFGDPALVADERPWPLWNLRAPAMLFVVGAAAFARRATPPGQAWVRHVLGGVVLAGLYATGLAEVIAFASPWSFGPRAASTSVYTLLFAIGVLVFGFRLSFVALRWVALALVLFVAGKVLVHDLSHADTPVRILVTGAFGAVALLVAWGYARRKAAA
jgi:uncharacterized membrane protein